MSRSRRKKPIVGIAGSVSEKRDKQRWHQAWRSTEKARLKVLTPQGAHTHLTLLERETVNVWSMAKDGKHYWSTTQRLKAAIRMAATKSRTPQENAALRLRLLKKWMGK